MYTGRLVLPTALLADVYQARGTKKQLETSRPSLFVHSMVPLQSCLIRPPPTPSTHNPPTRTQAAHEAALRPLVYCLRTYPYYGLRLTSAIHSR